MESRFKHLKKKATTMRRRGMSSRDIELSLKIPRSTLSSWCRNIPLTAVQKNKLKNNWRNALIEARRRAILWHNTQRSIKQEKAKIEAYRIFKLINVKNKAVLELALAMLYLGEGFKKKSMGIGNSDPEILKFFLKSINLLYGIKPLQLSCSLHLRSDQNSKK